MLLLWLRDRLAVVSVVCIPIMLPLSARVDAVDMFDENS